MDPYLEHPGLFPDLHDSLIFCIRDALGTQLPEPYFAGIRSRVWVEVSQRAIGPDVDVLRSPKGSAEEESSSAGGVALATAVAAKPVVVTVPHDETRESYIEIYTRPGGDRLVTTIEVLSLSNKTAGDQGRDLYKRKQREVLKSKTHLVEIDLLRAGEHTTAVPLDWALAKTGSFDYHVCTHHFDNLEDYYVYPIRLEMRLPAISIPLLPGEGSVTVDLQAALDRCYTSGQYQRRVRYGESTPEPPLSAGKAEWATRLLREKSLLT
jgi:hypothetical protein